MRSVILGSVAVLALMGSACGKKAPPAAEEVVVPAADAESAPADAAAKAPEDAAAAPADTAAAPDAAVAAPDAGAAAAGDAAAAPAPDAASDAAPAGDAAAAAAGDAAAVAAGDAAAVAAGDAAAAAAGDAAAAVMPEPVAPPKPVHDMNEDETKDWMKKTVVPTMRPRFQAYDAEEFAKVNCVTCHGEGAKEGKFELPNPKLTKLPITEAGWKALAEKEPEALKFMKETVLPAMATMLGEKPFDPATGKGFGCFDCHTKEQ